MARLKQTGFRIGGAGSGTYKATMIAIKAAYPGRKQETYIKYMSNFKSLLTKPMPESGKILITGRSKSTGSVVVISSDDDVEYDDDDEEEEEETKEEEEE